MRVTESRVRLRVGLVIWALGMLGVVAVAFTMIPQLVEVSPPTAPVGIVVAAMIAQSSVMLALMVWAGVRLGPKVGLRAPVIEAWVERRRGLPLLFQQLPAALLVGALSGLLLILFESIAPASLQAVNLDVPLISAILYGGVTEEVLVRFGLMTIVLWLMWRFIQRRNGPLKPVYAYTAITVCAVAFGAGHLPVTQVFDIALTPSVLLYIVGANALLGSLFGLLFLRYGLESAIIAHGLTHVVAAAVGALL
ncbi:MAG: CPBP family glutamic-type intramembrane protease [Firmicutes bacterium]|nr:CPBP family glutamic-type intramembrane protease [Bacillota bacterium]